MSPSGFDVIGGIADALLFFPLKLHIPPTKSRVIYLTSEEKRASLINLIYQGVGFRDLAKFYLEGEVLGKGQFGVVRNLRCKQTGSLFAVKIVKKQALKSAEVVQYLRELEALKLCRGHPNLVQLVDVFESYDCHQMVFEYLEGKDLFDYLNARNFVISEDRAKELTLQIALAIKHLHGHGIVHRDIKLENVMMTNNSERAHPKVIDLGLAKFLGPKEIATEPYGSLGYVAPEVIREKLYGFGCDMWSFGCLTYALLSGSLPFDHQSKTETVRLTLEAPLEFDLPCWTKVSLLAKDFITRLLVRDPRERLSIEGAIKHPWLKAARRGIFK